jgi:16S rRNA (uracil1498-N3)-methyltransferase
MSLRRLSAPAGCPALVPGARVALDPAEARHGALVLRLREGDQVALVSPQGLARAVVLESRKRPAPGLTLEITAPPAKGPAHPGPTLLLPLIRPSRFEWALEKCVELGAARLIPYVSSRTRAKGEAPGRPQRWERIAGGAQKQAARPDPLEILPPRGILDILMGVPKDGDDPPRILLERDAPLLSPGGPPGAWILVGPEGGLSPEELEAAHGASFAKRSLGSRFLRTETAAVAALGVLALSTAPLGGDT